MGKAKHIGANSVTIGMKLLSIWLDVSYPESMTERLSYSSRTWDYSSSSSILNQSSLIVSMTDSGTRSIYAIVSSISRYTFAFVGYLMTSIGKWATICKELIRPQTSWRDAEKASCIPAFELAKTNVPV